MNIGFCTSTRRAFAGEFYHAVELPPSVMISPCKITTEKKECSSGPESRNRIDELIFREDSFDPRTRIRRGRIYAAFESQPHTWRTLTGEEHSRCNTYTECSIWNQFLQEGKRDLYVLLGDKVRYSVWKVIDIEMNVGGEEVVTLRALTTFGLLPELIESEIPEQDLEFICRSLDLVADEAHTASADSVVDGCREAASAIVGAYLQQPAKDLGKLANALQAEKKFLAGNAASLINLLHPRRKASELRGRGLRRLCDEDAQLAVQCLGTILIELGWGRW